MTVSQTDECDSDRAVGGLVSLIDESHFQSWYQERELRQRIRDGNHYDDSHTAPNRHHPSRLLQCHRKAYYKAYDAPRENRKPVGVFWIGNQFETDIALPFLRDTVPPGQYVRNSVWIEFTIESAHGDLRFRGMTDPVIVDEEGNPVLLTEIKTTSSFVHLDKPKPHHKAQVHAYLYGLSEKFDVDIEDAVIIYSKRADFELCSFHISFDPDFWNDTVLNWAEENSRYRQTQELPPARPEADWECSICPFKQRCGKSDGQYHDLGFFGLLPRFKGYPKEQVKRYLQAHTDAKLTPTLAYHYPDLTDEYESYDWQCPVCSRSYPMHEIDWGGNLEHLPLCPACCNNETPAPLSAPPPEAQRRIREYGRENNALK